ncbi:MAG: hypothetical protein IIY78_04145 [Clostridia bacterium]|nr:hypothetical protein [Clostridia bacterium]
MSIRNRIISVISAICLLGSAACFSVFAADTMNPSGDEEIAPAPAAPVVEEPAAPVVEVPATPAVTDPVITEPTYPVEEPQQTYEPPVETQPTEPAPTVDPGYTQEPTAQGGDTQATDPGTAAGSYTYSDLINDTNYPQPTYNPPATPYADTTTEQYNQYLYYSTQAQYDDNYIYVPEYQEPTESMISTSSKTIDTDELTNSDWNSIILDLSNGAANTAGGTQTFDFIKDNEEEGDTDMSWLVYVGSILLIAAFLLITYVIVSTSKANAKHEYVYL